MMKLISTLLSYIAKLILGLILGLAILGVIIYEPYYFCLTFHNVPSNEFALTIWGVGFVETILVVVGIFIAFVMGNKIYNLLVKWLRNILDSTNKK